MRATALAGLSASSARCRAVSSDARPLRASHDHLVGSLSLWTKLRAHSGCVNTISWCADDPSLLASGSDDTRVLVWRVPPRISADDPLRPASTTDTGHTHNIFGVVFVPRTPGEVVTCAADGEVRHHDLEAQRTKLLLPTPGGGGGAFSDAPMAFKLAFLPGQPHALLCSYQDGAVRLLDLRVAAASRSADVVAQLGAGVLATSFAFHPAAPTMYALGADPDPLVRLLDLRRPSTTTADAALCFAPSHALAELSQMETPRRWRSMRHGASGVDFSPSGVLAATYRDGPACLDAARAAPTAWAAGEAVCCEAPQLKGGHRNSRTFLKECRFLWDGRHVATGSDCGHLFVYEAYGGGEIASLCADRHIVNCVAPHPSSPWSPRRGSSIRSSSSNPCCPDPPTRAKPMPTPTAARRAAASARRRR